MTHWFARDWWTYLLARRTRLSASWPRVLWCRCRGHPYRVVWFRVGGLEPDMTCTNCGDDLG